MNRILIAEDEARIANFIEKGLRKNGFTTAIAPDGEQAVLMVKTDEFDLLLLDLGLPIKDGWAVLKELRAQEKQIPVIVVTARDDLADKAIAQKYLVNDYITKPFSFQDLLEKVFSHLERSN
ncbi:MAG: response regulator [Cyanosarcina radialis HA8281-LM2]|jgi:DNA-binding response OmpR family regulator|nr:response regulator [Cyanosarcina radialis HA8281-LM2]